MLLPIRSIVAVFLGTLGTAQHPNSLATASAETVEPADSHADSAPAAPDGCHAHGWRGYFGGWFANVYWTDNSDDEGGFIVEWRGPGTEGTIVLPANTAQAYDLPNGKGFKYRVRAFNASGLSGWSNWATPQYGGGA